MKKILFIHGINNQENSAENIIKEWSDELKQAARTNELQFPENVKFLAAFYGDILSKETKAWNEYKFDSSSMSIDSPDEDYANSEVAKLYIEFQHKLGITDKQIYAEIGEDDAIHKAMAKGIHKKWLKAITKILENILPTKGKFLARAFLPQAAAYLHKPGLKDQIDNLVKDQIFKEKITEDDEIIIISHSLGTIIAYSLMLRLRHEVKPKLLITAGSPLGIEIVKKRLGSPLICPPNVNKWDNISDPEDFVALETKLTSKNFGCGSIYNKKVDNGYKDAHDILKYLSHKTIIEEIINIFNNPD